MIIEEIVTGIWNKNKAIQVGFSVYLNYKYLEYSNPNYKQILENLFEAFIKGKVINLELEHGRIHNVTLTEKSAKGFEFRHLENYIKVKIGLIESFHFNRIEDLNNQFGLILKLKKGSNHFYIPLHDFNLLEWSKIITYSYSYDKQLKIEYMDRGLVCDIKVEE